MKVSHSWLQTYFDQPLPKADELAELLTFHSFEVEGVEQVGDDTVIDIDVLANRSSDCLSHRGIARELSNVLGLPMKRDPLRDTLPQWPAAESLKVTVEDHNLCTRYMGAVVQGVTVGPSPDWLRTALETLGQKSINNVVDATNFVMLDIGQPLHVFDVNKLAEASEGVKHITVRSAQEHEVFVSLSGESYELAPRNLIIADGAAGSVLALAGIKGGKEAEVTNETTDLIIEAAHFNYVSVRKTSRELRLQTDASVRFQNDPSPFLPAFAMRDVINRIVEIAGGQLIGVTEMFRMPTPHSSVSASLTDINSVLGATLSIDDVERILVRFEFDFSRDKDMFVVTPPWERTDITIKEDLIEEIGRIHGYSSLTGSELPEAGRADVHPEYAMTETVRHFLSERGYSEVYTYTLRASGEVALENPLASDKAFLRPSIREGLREALEKNARQAPLLGLDTVKIFELGPVFTSENEYASLALGVRAVRGKQSAAEKELRADFEALASLLGIETSSGVIEDGVLEFNLSAATAESTPPTSYGAPLRWDTHARFSQWSAFPFSTRDIAVWVAEGTRAEEVLAVLIEATSDLLVRHDLFDEFTKEGKTSFAYHLVFQARDRTLTDDEVGNEMKAVEEKLKERGWEVR